MKYSIYSYKDIALGCFSTPFYDDRPVENVATGVARSICSSEHPEKVAHKILFRIGEMEDITGVIVPLEHELVLDCDQLLTQLKKVGEQHGIEKETKC